MTAVLPGRFANSSLRPVKRQLSTFEKKTVPTTDGRALLLPSHPNTEIEELTEAGYSPCYIFGVEIDGKLYHQLLEHYHDSAHIFHGDIFQWMKRARGLGQYSYIHLDFCGHFTRDEATKMQAWAPLVAPVARLRVSVFRGRRSPLQFDWEERMQEQLLLRWCELGHELDTVDPERWITYYNHFQETSDDTTKIITAVVILNFFFGIDDYRAYIDDCIENGDYLPTVEGTHRPTGVTRYLYNEPGTPNHMFTVWVDLEPLPADPLRNSTQWTLNELAHMFDRLNYHVPVFNPGKMKIHR